MGITSSTIIITGASGLVARFLIRSLLNIRFEGDIIAVSNRNDVLTEKYFLEKSVTCISNSDFINNDNLWRHLSPKETTLVHCAFTRTNDNVQVASSIEYAYQVFQKCKKYTIGQVINLSSRSVYLEPQQNELNVEESVIAPNGLIGIGKYSTELLLESFFDGTEVQYTNLRLASVNELKTDNTMVRPLNVFVNAVINQQQIKVKGGSQIMSFIDPIDVAEAIIAIIKNTKHPWNICYNVGTGWMCTESLIDMANRVNKIGEQLGHKSVEIIIEPFNVVQRAGLDITKLSTDTGWVPRIDLDKMISRLFELSENNY